MKILLKFVTVVVILLTTSFGYSQYTSHLRGARGWYKGGSEPDSYDMGVSDSERFQGKPAACIRSLESVIDGWGDYYQQSLPGAYEGKSVKLSGYVRTVDVKGHAVLWLQALDSSQSVKLADDDMLDREIIGTTGWKKYEIILDIPKGSALMRYGIGLRGTGTCYLADLHLEILGPATGNVGTVKIPPMPTNLDFTN